MFRSATPVSVAELAQLLIARKKEKKRTILFLGTRTGGLFGNQAFYTDIQRYSMRRLNTLSEIEKFHECLYVLKNLVNERDLQDPETKNLLEKFMSDWLQEAAEHNINSYVAELVKLDFFDIIISTNTDHLLEDAFDMLGMKKSRDYSVLNILDATSDQQMLGETPYTIIKVFGELVPGHYKDITREISWNGIQKLRKLLNTLLDRDMLAIGYDSLVDEQMELALLITGELWYVNISEALPKYTSAFVNALENRGGKYIVGINHERFLKEIYDFIRSSEYLVRNIDENSKRRNIFISYSHKDKAFLDRFLVHLDLGNEKDLLDIWCDTRLEGGEDWHKEIQEAIAKTKVAVFLVSQDFIASKYIKEQELPPLLKAASIGEVTLLSVILYPCNISKIGLDRYQLMNDPLSPLGGMSKQGKERIWLNTARHVIKLLFS